jgi:nitrogen fixation protein FixH
MTLKFHWGVAVALFYAAFALSTVGFVVYALSLDVQLVSEDYYARALGHDEHMQAVANGAALGSAIGVTVDTDRLDVRLPPAMASLVRGTATLYRAANSSADRTVALVLAPDGTQVIPTAGLAPGQWRLQLRWSADGRDYYAERDIRLP